MNSFSDLCHPDIAQTKTSHIQQIKPVILAGANLEHGFIKSPVACLSALLVVGIVAPVMHIAGWRQVRDGEQLE
jgi:hypothetical protein